MQQSKRYNIFISHAWSYGEDYDHLVNLLDNAPNFLYKNYSAPEDKPLISSNSYVSEIKLKKEIDNKIRYAQCVLIIGGMYAKRTWMKYELESARSMGKPIIVVAPRGQERIPTELQIYPIVYWNTNSIINAIKEFSL